MGNVKECGLTGKERTIRALKREPVPGHVPHFELVYYLTMEKFGKVHPTHRVYAQWNRMSAAEQRLHLSDMADCSTAMRCARGRRQKRICIRHVQLRLYGPCA